MRWIDQDASSQDVGTMIFFKQVIFGDRMDSGVNFRIAHLRIGYLVGNPEMCYWYILQNIILLSRYLFLKKALHIIFAFVNFCMSFQWVIYVGKNASPPQICPQT